MSAQICAHMFPWESVFLSPLITFETILQATDSNDVWYDLNGRRLVDTPKSGGVYIRNGVKVVVVNYNSK